MKRRITWLSERDGIGHAHVGRGRIARTACGQRAIDPRHAWPTVSLHPECVEAVKRIQAEADAAARSR